MSKLAKQRGFNMGARKIDCEEYLPEPGDWEETNVLFDFGDGWLVCEDRTEYDRRLMAKLTKTCIGTTSYITRCFPGVSEDEFWEARRQQFRKSVPEESWAKSYSRAGIEAQIRQLQNNGYDSYYTRSLQNQLDNMGDTEQTYDEFIESKVNHEKKLAAGNVQNYGPQPPLYRFAHIRDPEGRPRACILLVRADAIKGCPGYETSLGNWANYADSNDLGQNGFINIEGQDFRMTEIRLGTGRTGPREALERAAIFYQEVVGEWDQEAFERVQGPRYTGVEVKDDLSSYRRKS